jgi:hypothetical protein
MTHDVTAFMHAGLLFLAQPNVALIVSCSKRQTCIKAVLGYCDST